MVVSESEWLSLFAAELGTERKTVRRWLKLGHAPLWKQPRGNSILDPFIGFITRRWNEGCRNVAQLWRELVPLGFRGRPNTVRHWASKHLRHAASEDRCARVSSPPVWPVPSGYRLARLLMADPSKLNSEDELFRTCLLEDEPALGDTIAWAQQLSAILRRKATGDLADIIAAGNDPKCGCCLIAWIRRIVGTVGDEATPACAIASPFG